MNSYVRFALSCTVRIFIGFMLSVIISLVIAVIGLFLSYVTGIDPHFMIVMRWAFYLCMIITGILETCIFFDILYLIPKKFKVSRTTAMIAIEEFKLYNEKYAHWTPEDFARWFDEKQFEQFATQTKDTVMRAIKKYSNGTTEK